jgi:hypothetical protein
MSLVQRSPTECVFLEICMIYEPQQTVTLALSMAAVPQKESNINFTYKHSNYSRRLLTTPQKCGCFRHVVLLWSTFQNKLFVSKAMQSSRKYIT